MPRSGGGRLLHKTGDALPDILVIADDECCFPLVTLVAAEVVGDRPGQRAAVNRLLDLMLVTTLRAWFDRPQRHAPVWYRTRSATQPDVLKLRQAQLRRESARRRRQRIARRRSERPSSPPGAEVLRHPFGELDARDLVVQPRELSGRIDL
ncbi:cupin domain-containing protein [Nonomuraea guangzhouensis]|uniref:cupin domain-containing protein n=1 Tax=Nonomuraea guangzhouensis TaxID=1291555 RepID=UPI003558D080